MSSYTCRDCGAISEPGGERNIVHKVGCPTKRDYDEFFAAFSPSPSAKREDYDRQRALGVIRAFVDEERRAGTRFNDLNAEAVEAFVMDVTGAPLPTVADSQHPAAAPSQEAAPQVPTLAIAQTVIENLYHPDADEADFDAAIALVQRLHRLARSGVEDTARLDWLAANDAHLTGGTGHGTVGVCWWPEENAQRCIGGETVREAIDRARGNAGEVPAASATESRGRASSGERVTDEEARRAAGHYLNIGASAVSQREVDVMRRALVYFLDGRATSSGQSRFVEAPRLHESVRQCPDCKIILADDAVHYCVKVCPECEHPLPDHVVGHGCTARVPTSDREAAAGTGEECDCRAEQTEGWADDPAPLPDPIPLGDDVSAGIVGTYTAPEELRLYDCESPARDYSMHVCVSQVGFSFTIDGDPRSHCHCGRQPSRSIFSVTTEDGARLARLLMPAVDGVVTVRVGQSHSAEADRGR